eukprot:7009408-Prymnesium_polylepis.1
MCAGATPSDNKRPCRFNDGCDDAMFELARVHGASVVSMRNALYDEARNASSTFHFEQWTLDAGLHLTLRR